MPLKYLCVILNTNKMRLKYTFLAAQTAYVDPLWCLKFLERPYKHITIWDQELKMARKVSANMGGSV